MPIRIFNNLSALTTQRALDSNSGRVGSNIERIASGIRVNRSADDAASFAISQYLQSDARVLRQAGKNANSALSMINTAEGALNEVGSIMVRLRELAAQASTGTIGTSDRDSVALEFNQLKDEIDRIAKTTEFNGKKLLDGTLEKGHGDPTVIVLGLDSSSPNLFNLNNEIDLTDSTVSGLGIASVSVSTRSNALLAIRDLGDAINNLSEVRGRVGSTLNRLTRAATNLNVSVQTLTDAESQIRDADLGEEFAELTKNQILVQSSSAMVGQSNLIPRSVLQLLG